MLVEALTEEEISYNEEPYHVAFMHQNVNFAVTVLKKYYPDFPGVAAQGILPLYRRNLVKFSLKYTFRYNFWKIKWYS